MPCVNTIAGGGGSVDLDLDPHWDKVVLLAHLDEAAPIDYSDSGHTLTVSGAARDTGMKRFGDSSFEFAGSAQYIEAADSDDWWLTAPGSPDDDPLDFTIECFIRFNSALSGGHDRMILSQVENSGGNRAWLWYLFNQTMYFEISENGSTQHGIFSGFNWSDAAANTWHHIVVQRRGDLWTHFVNGEERDSATDSAVIHNAATEFRIGNDVQNSFGGDRQCHIDEVRITKGVARYPEGSPSFEVPTAPFPNA